MNCDTLELIQKTAVRANAPEVYRVGPRRQLRIDRNTGGLEYITEDAPEVKNEVYEIEDAVRVFRSYEDSTIWVGRNEIVVLHNTTEQLGRTKIEIEMSSAAAILQEADNEEGGLSGPPDAFEKVALLRFGCDPSFIQTLRNLQWDREEKESAQISAVHKSMSSSALTRVLKRDGTPFEEVTITVRTPIFEVPIQTKEETIKVSVIANALEKTITFAPEPGVMSKLIHNAVRELYVKVIDQLTENEIDRVFMGTI